MIEAQESMIGVKVAYSVGEEERQGVIVDKIILVDKGADAAVTGYLIQEMDTEKLWSVHHWRIQKVIY